MEAELKYLHSPDVYDLKAYEPTNSKEFSIFIQIMIGIKGEEGEESFNIILCTPEWIKVNYGPEDILIGRHHIIVQEYNYERLEKMIKEYIAKSSADTWGEIAEKLARLGHWEFEDYNS